MKYGDYNLVVKNSIGEIVTLWCITLGDALQFMQDNPARFVRLVHDDYGVVRIIKEAA